MKRSIQELWKPKQQIPSEKVLIWAVFAGVVGALISTAYKITLKYIILVLWNIFPKFLEKHGVFGDKFPIWNYTWILCTIIGLVTGLLIRFSPRKPGSLKLLLEALHEKGVFSSTHFIPMALISLVSISAGTSTGPEVSVLVMMGSFANFFNNLNDLPRFQKRIISLCWMGSGISSFFGLPLGGALFVLEIPHRMGIQYYEALSPVMISSLVSVAVSKSITNDLVLSGTYMYPSVTMIRAYEMFIGIGIGFIGALLAFIFTFLVRTTKTGVEKMKVTSKYQLRFPVITMTIGGLMIGWIGVLYPQTLFWSEFEIPTLLSRGSVPLPHTTIPSIMNIAVPYSTVTFVGIAFSKILAIVICVVLSFPGGILFPIYYVGLALGFVLSDLVPFVHPTVAIMALMTSFQVAILRTAWATNIILLILSAPITQVPNDYLGVFTVMTVSSYTALFLTRKYHYYPHSMQKSRTDADITDEVITTNGERKIYKLDSKDVGFGEENRSLYSSLNSDQMEPLLAGE